MSRILTLELTDEVFESVQQLASERGEAVGDFCLRHLQADIEEEKRRKSIESDPFWQAAGSLDSGTPDLAARHDHYLGEALADNHQND